jgi:hypothetical protein
MHLPSPVRGESRSLARLISAPPPMLKEVIGSTHRLSHKEMGSVFVSGGHMSREQFEEAWRLTRRDEDGQADPGEFWAKVVEQHRPSFLKSLNSAVQSLHCWLFGACRDAESQRRRLHVSRRVGGADVELMLPRMDLNGKVLGRKLVRGNSGRALYEPPGSSLLPEDLTESNLTVSIQTVHLKRQQPLVFRLQGRSRILWNGLTLIFLLYLVVMMPLSLGFDLEPSQSQFYFEKLIDVFFIADLIMNFRTTYIDDFGREVLQPSKIATRYLRTWFTVDLASSVPYDWFLETSGEAKTLKTAKFSKSTKALKCIRLVRLARLTKMGKYLSALEDWFSMNRLWLKGSKMLAGSWVLAHLLACFWAFVGGLADDGQTNWKRAYLESLAMDEAEWESWGLGGQYLASIYFTVTSITTVGYGDIKPVTHYERFFTIITLLIGAASYGFVIGDVATMVGNADVNSRRFNEKMDSLQSYLSARRIPSSLAFRIRTHFKHLLLHKTAIEEQSILDALSPQVRHC